MSVRLAPPKTKATGKTVLLFSGGLDSLLIAHLMKPDVLLRVQYGSAYESQEDAALAELQRKNLLPEKAAITTQSMQFLRYHEREGDAIIPLRNLFFVSLAALYGETVILGAMKYDAKLLDKSGPFFDMSSKLLTYLFSPQPWCEGKTVRVVAPFDSYTKGDLVRAFLNSTDVPLTRAEKEETLLTSFSCHTPGQGGKPCGQCKPCLRKWLALEMNGVRIPDGYFETNPWESPMAKGILDGTYQTSTMTKGEILVCREKVLSRQR